MQVWWVTFICHFWDSLWNLLAKSRKCVFTDAEDIPKTYSLFLSRHNVHRIHNIDAKVLLFVTSLLLLCLRSNIVRHVNHSFYLRT